MYERKKKELVYTAHTKNENRMNQLQNEYDKLIAKLWEEYELSYTASVAYLKEMGGEMDSAYAEPDGRKVVYSSLNPVKLLRNANKFTYIIIAVVVVVLAIVIGVPVLIVRSVKKRRAKKAQA